MKIKQAIMSLVALVLIAGCDTTFEGGEFRVKSFTSEGCANCFCRLDDTETVTFNYDATLNKSISFPRN